MLNGGMMFYSLRFGILMAMLAVAAIAITTITIFVGLTTRAEFSRYVEAGREIREERLQEAIIMWADNDTINSLDEFAYLEAFNTSGIESTGFRFRPLGAVGTFERVSGQAPTTNTSLSALESSPIRFAVAPDGSVNVVQNGASVGQLYVDPVSEYELIIAQNNFVESVNWTLLVTAIMAGLAAVALTVILSRRILHPVAALTIAARRMERGDLSQRVAVYATGGEIGELSHAFNAMASALQRNEDLRRSMVTDIAHELRTPLTNIRGYLEAIQDEVLEADRETIDLLYEEATLLYRLIQDLQELALAEAGQLHIEKQELSLEDLVEQSMSALQPSATQKSIQLYSNLPPDMPLVSADQRRVTQILHNLINNAITHTPNGGKVGVSAEVYPTEIEISVRDTGEGIDAEHLPYLFERFYRADPSRSRATGGAGLGLAIVKQLVGAQGGRVQVESIKGKGATFTFTLPRVTV